MDIQLSEYNKLINEFEELQQISFKPVTANYPFVVAFCGEFSSGKTTLINKLLSDSSICMPTGVNPVTKLVTRIKYGKQLAFFSKKSNKFIEISKAEYNEIVQDAEGTLDIQELLITVPSEILKADVEFLDTPGFQDEVVNNLKKNSRDAIDQADFVVFCFNSTKLGTMFEKEYIENLKESFGNFCMVVSRIDNLHGSELQDIRLYANSLVRDAGGMSWNIFQTNTFFCAMNDKHCILDGFDRLLTSFLKNIDLKMSVRKSTLNNKKTFKLKSITQNIKEQIYQFDNKLQQFQQIHEEHSEKHKLEATIGFKKLIEPTDVEMLSPNELEQILIKISLELQNIQDLQNQVLIKKEQLSRFVDILSRFIQVSYQTENKTIV